MDLLKYISLGQGQEAVAERLINEGRQNGNWVLLQNCHLFKSWMPQLEAICQTFEDDDSINLNFRLILTSMPKDYFPVFVLQSGLKMTTEPPRGLKANLQRTYMNAITQQTYDEIPDDKENTILVSPDLDEEFSVTRRQAWQKLLFSLSFFHALVQERRKFGPLGWNKAYEFSDSDLLTSITMLKNFLLDNDEIPWDAMKFMTG